MCMEETPWNIISGRLQDLVAAEKLNDSERFDRMRTLFSAVKVIKFPLMNEETDIGGLSPEPVTNVFTGQFDRVPESDRVPDGTNSAEGIRVSRSRSMPFTSEIELEGLSLPGHFWSPFLREDERLAASPHYVWECIDLLNDTLDALSFEVAPMMSVTAPMKNTAYHQSMLDGSLIGARSSGHQGGVPDDGMSVSSQASASNQLIDVRGCTICFIVE